jgi:hypothetical protein
MIDIEFSTGHSKAEKARMRARYAALLGAIGNGQAASGQYQGGLIRGAIVHELLTPERRVTRRGFDWLAGYTGPVAPAADIVITEKTKSGPKRPVVPKRPDKRFREFAAELIFNAMGHAQSHVMLHKRLFALPPDGFYLFAWLIVHGAQHRTAGAVALALGWPVERTAAAMRDIVAAGYPLPARVALPAALQDAA